jgi:hypothetical protein
MTVVGEDINISPKIQDEFYRKLIYPQIRKNYVSSNSCPPVLRLYIFQTV